MKKLLIPIDGSKIALRALAFALDDAQRDLDVQIHLINVQPPLLHVWPGKLLSPDLVRAELQREGELLLVDALGMTNAADVRTTAHVRVGDPAQEIAGCAAQFGCTAIVMGTRGAGALEGMVMGSIAHKVVHLSPLPVTLVK
jgi:nucleotide-binding universal stress UspA family protein